MNIAFVFIAEEYQVYHGAAVAFDLMKRPGVTVTFYYNDPAVPHHMERIRRAYDMPPIPYIRLARNPAARAIQAVRLLGLAKESVLRTNEAELARYDAVVSLEDGTSILFGDRPRDKRPARILIQHGDGDRAVPSWPRRKRFDLILVGGEKYKQRLLDMGIARPGHIAAPGYPKLDTSRRLAQTERPLFANDRPIVLYNPHKARGFQSWSRFIEPMLRAFAAQDEFNLIVAPHIKMFRRRSERLRRRWRARSTPTILIDPGSERSLDNTYTTAADIYVGDVSSQVYEFVTTPRPCLFLNAHDRAWQGDPDFLFWQLGDVIERPEQLMDAIRQAPAHHALYLPRQQELTARSFSDISAAAARHAADDILQLLRDGRVSG